MKKISHPFYRFWRWLTDADIKESEWLRQAYLKRTGRTDMRSLPREVRERTYLPLGFGDKPKDR